MTEAPIKVRVLEALKRIKSPGSGADIVAEGLVSEIVINQGKVYFAISVDPARAGELEALRKVAEQTVAEVPGVTGVTVTLLPIARRRRQRQRRHRAGLALRARRARRATHAIAPAACRGRRSSPSPGKGGVGKSTTAVNLALALKETGLKVGILDADIYGPSMPRLLGLKGQPQQLSGDKLAPMEAYGLKVMSMGFLVDEETPMIWRGPMVMSALSQMLKDVAWGELDVLVVDMPPGTGDAQLTMAQQVPLAGAVIVSTPQDLALIDARKGLNMFRKVNVPVLGIVENMSTFICPHCGEPSNIFGHGGARAEAARLGVPFLGDVPLTIAIRETSDEGRPVVATDPSSPAAQAYREIAERAWAELERDKGAARQAPRIVMES
jgi:ATP-binding protein involved in chromosome partitioning